MAYNNILSALKNACLHISLSLKNGDTGELSNQIGYINQSGDYTNNIDLYSNQIIKGELMKCLNVWGIASEEDKGITSRFSDDDDCTYFVSFDPRDGSANVDCNISVGTIFTIFETPEGVYPKSGRDIVCAGYCMYSQCTQLVIADKDGVKMYTLHSHIKTFTNEQIIAIPEKGCLYSINESGKYINAETINKISMNLIEKIFNINETEPIILIEDKNKYFIIELTKTENIKMNIEDELIKKEILLDLAKVTKRKLTAEIIDKINKKNFSKLDFDKLSKDELDNIQKISIKNQNDDFVLKKEIINQI